jgi:N4-gp56 family major capsid protein
MALSKLENMINPEVMADMISAQLPAQLKFTKIAKIDDTLEGRPGDTITVPIWDYIGTAEIVDEGEDAPVKTLTATKGTATVTKAAIGVHLSDESVLSAYGDPVGETGKQLAKSLAEAVDIDCLGELQSATKKYDGSAAVISYDAVVNALDLFEDENDNSEYVIYVSPKQITQLRKDDEFKSKEQYGNAVMFDGEIGMIAGAHVVKSKRLAAESGKYSNPIVQVNVADDEGNETLPALTIYTKRKAMVESQRNALNGTTLFVGNVHYAAKLTNASKVVVLECKATA